MAKRVRIYFATDVHGSEKCFRKFLNGGRVYEPDVMILGGDVAGKAIQSIQRAPGGRYAFSFRGVRYDLEEGEELERVEQLIADHGYYPRRSDPGELDALEREGALDALFLEMMRDRLARWMELADERLRPLGRPVYWMLGNDDPTELQPVLDEAPWGEASEGHIAHIDGHEVVSLGYSNITPFKSHRELTEDQIRDRLTELAGRLDDPSSAVFNVHVPPFDSGLDEAPVVDESLQVQASIGQVRFQPVGSTAVRDVLMQVQPLVGLHGHIHESAGFRKLGRTLAVNPGSDYNMGALNGAIVTLDRDKVKSHQLVRG